MTNDTRTADRIERDSENERAELSDSINDLQKKFSVEGIVHDVGDMFRGKNGELGGELGRSIADTIGRNPAATALTAVGLAWMFFGPFGGNDQRGDTLRRTGARNDHARDDHRSWPSDETWARRSGPTGAYADRPQYDDDRFRIGDEGHAPGSAMGRAGKQTAHGAGRSSDQPAGGISGTVRSGAESIGDSIADVADGVRDQATNIKDWLSQGTEDFSDEAKARVLAARQAAHDARMAAEAAMNRGGRAAVDLFEDQPLVVGALALALGAAIGGALPRSRMEDDALGASSDRLFEEAQAVFREERDKAMAVLGAAADEAKEVIHDASSDVADMVPEAESAGEAIADRMSDAGTRVADEARDEAERQGLAKRKV